MKKIIFIALLTLSACMSKSETELTPTYQNSPIGGETSVVPNWIHFTEENGLASNNVTSIVLSPTGAIWFGTQNGVSYFDGNTWVTYTTENGLPSNKVNAVAVTSDGELWVGTYGAGIARLDGHTWMIYTTEDGLSDNYIRAIAVAPDNTIWVGSESGGITHFDGRQWINYSVQDDLLLNTVRTILIDYDGNIWFGGNEGAIKFDGSKWTTFPLGEGVNVVCLTSINGEILIGLGNTGTGIYRLNDGIWNSYEPISRNLPSQIVLSLYVDSKQGLWIGTNNGLFFYDTSGLRAYSDQVMGPVWDIVESPNGNLWFATDEGVYSFGE